MKDKLLNITIYILLLATIVMSTYMYIIDHNVSARNIQINNNIINLEVSETEQLTGTIIPAEVKDKTIIWRSEDSSIATVDNNGLVTAKKSGWTAIIASSKDGKAQNKCYVVVKESPLTPTPVATPTPTIKPTVAPTIKPTTSPIVTQEPIVTVAPTIKPTPIPTPKPTPVPTPKVTPIPVYEVQFNGVTRAEIILRRHGEKIGSLPSQTKAGYIFIGWYTDKVSGTKVTENTIVTSHMNIYPHFKLDESAYVITRDAPIPSGFVTTNYNYDSESLKYKVYRDSVGYYFALIWVKDSAKQLQSALPMRNDGNTNFHKVKVDKNINNEINKYGYTNKGIIAVNGSFSWSSDPGIRVIINRGEIVRSLTKDNGPKYSSLGIRSNGELKGYDTGASLEANMVADGVLNNWAIVGYTTTNWSGFINGETARAARTQICQIDKNNFILLNIINSKGVVYPMGWKIMHDYFPNCKFAANLDGGGSTRMYYKTNTMNKVATIYESYDTNRNNVDALYFVEQ